MMGLALWHERLRSSLGKGTYGIESIAVSVTRLKIVHGTCWSPNTYFDIVSSTWGLVPPAKRSVACLYQM